MDPSSRSVPLVHVVLSALNAASTIERALGSSPVGVAVSTEVIVVDDGSEDATAETVGDLTQTDARIRHFPTARRRSGPERQCGSLPFFEFEGYKTGLKCQRYGASEACRGRRNDGCCTSGREQFWEQACEAVSLNPQSRPTFLS
jgi:hypothetical protein